jgi:hypothetical protein
MKHSEMNDSTIELGLTKEEMMPILEASDEALEIAASSAEEKANYTPPHTVSRAPPNVR